MKTSVRRTQVSLVHDYLREDKLLLDHHSRFWFLLVLCQPFVHGVVALLELLAADFLRDLLSDGLLVGMSFIDRSSRSSNLCCKQSRQTEERCTVEERQFSSNSLFPELFLLHASDLETRSDFTNDEEVVHFSN